MKLAADQDVPHVGDLHVVFSTIGVNLLSLALPVMTLQIYDRILPNPESGTLPVLVAGVTVAIMLETCLKLARAYMIGWSGAAYEYGMVSAAMRHILGADTSRIARNGMGEQLHRMAAIGKLRDFHSGYSLSASIDAGFVFVYAGFIFYVAGPLAAVPLTLLAVFALVSFVEGRRLRHRLVAREAMDDRRYDFLIESLDAIHAVKAYALENIFCRRYESLQRRSVTANIGVAGATAAMFNTGTVMSNVIAAATITAGAVLVLEGHVTTGALIATLLLAGRMMQAVQRALALWVRYQDCRVARARAAEIFALPSAPRATEEPTAERLGTLRITGLEFRFEDSAPLLKDVGFNLAPGDALLLGGDYAAGKSTLLSMVAGVFPPTAGKIAIDGFDVRLYPPETLTRHVGYISAEPVIFRGTIRDNITRFGEIPERAARDVAAQLGVDRDVARLPAGFDTLLYGSGGDAVPPGLKQRIAMTRVLAAGPRIILFDAADQSLDREGHRLVLRLLASLKEICSLIIVSEDPDIAALATHRATLVEGRLQPEKEMP